MVKFTFSKITRPDLKRLIHLDEKAIANYEWTQVESLALEEKEERQLQDIRGHLLNYDTHLMNEATIWARAIYPLLLLAEQGPIQAWAEVSLQARYVNFELEGIADGTLGKCVAGLVESAYLVVLEAKRGLEAENPLIQVYGQLLAAAHLNWEKNGNEPQEIFGCYTIADSWKFMRAEIAGIETEKPTMRVEYSREYIEKREAETIFKIIKKIVNQYISVSRSHDVQLYQENRTAK